MNKSKCQCCDAYAKYDLKLDEELECEYCDHIMHKKGEKLRLCKLECSNLYWMLDKDEIDSETNTITAYYFMEKDECNCGKRNYFTGKFVGKIIEKSKDNCECCEKKAKYFLNLDHDIHCKNPKCKKIKYNKSFDIILCSTQCKNLAWKHVEYLTKPGLENIKLIYQLKNDKCESCSTKTDAIGLFSGINKRPIKKNNKSKPKNQITNTKPECQIAIDKSNTCLITIDSIGMFNGIKIQLNK